MRTSGHVGGTTVLAHPIHADALLERGAQPGEDALLLLRRDFFAAHRRERAQQLVFFGGEPTGHVDIDAHEQITTTTTAQRGNTASLEPEHVSGLGAPGHDELFGSFERLDVEPGAQAPPA